MGVIIRRGGGNIIAGTYDLLPRFTHARDRRTHNRGGIAPAG